MTLDAIVIGAGPNGLSAAITLARAGRAVRVYEQAPTIGGSTRSEALTLPGHVHDVCATVHSLVLASPFLKTLPLAGRDVVLVQILSGASVIAVAQLSDGSFWSARAYVVVTTAACLEEL